ncbi:MULTISPECIES: HAAS signaling domain-containing protein [Bacillaceae]|uniref:Uncharacterized protein n=1 Tax=Evansella alkalicola TaxID=745819 RepID=A0ABS6JV12_9BACI|nr:MULTISPECIES: hypothetical protein [Bacillaceae]MBU9722426.1 hypothetical protein [Bacillus alkalicola]
MEVIDRYIYAVVHRLPANQREDIERELRGLIADMKEERTGVHAGNGNDDEEIVEEVLLELGNPRELGDKYRGKKRYLIGPDLYDSYWSILKIVLVALGIAMSVVYVIQAIMTPQNILQHFIEFFATVISAGIQGFAWVTVIFMIMEARGVNKDSLGIEEGVGWKLSDLPSVPDDRLRIMRSEPIIGIVFSILLVVFFIFSNHFFAVFTFQDGDTTSIPVFNDVGIRAVLPYLYVLLGLGILKECVKLVAKKWTPKLAFFNIIVNAVSFIFIIFVFTEPTLWNQDFMGMMVDAGVLAIGSDAYQTVMSIWQEGQHIILILIGIGYLIDTIVPLVNIYLKGDKKVSS